MAIVGNHQWLVQQTSEAYQWIKLSAGAKPYLPGLNVTFLLQKDLFYFNRFEKQMDARKVKVYTSWEYSRD